MTVKLPLNVYLRPALDEAALLGLPGEIARRTAEATGADVAATLLATLTMLGNAAGPEPHVEFGGAEHPGRLFAVIVGDAAAGRKGTAVTAVRRIFADADPEWAGRRIDHGLKSPEAMIARVDDDGDDTRLMVLEEEFARLAATMARTSFSPVLRAAWDGRPIQNTVKDPKRRRLALHAHVSVLGMITPAELERHHARLSQAGGLESRILYVLSAPSADTDPFTAQQADYSDLVDRLRMTLDISRSGVLERTDPISREIFLMRGTGFQPSTVLPLAGEVVRDWKALVRDRLPAADADEVAGLRARGEVQVVRLAAAYAIGDAAAEIGPGHIDAAMAVWQFCAESAEILFGVAAGRGGGRVDPVKARHLLDLLRKSDNEWMTETQISSGFGRNTNAADLQAIRSYLAEKGLIENGTKATGGRPAHEWRLTPPKPPVRKNEKSA